MFAPFPEIFLFLRKCKIFLVFFGSFCKLVGGGGYGIIDKMFLRPCGPLRFFLLSSLKIFRTAPAGRRGSLLILPLPPRRRRGLLFARAKRSKRSLKELRSLRILLHYGGYCFLRFHCGLSGLNWTAPMDQAKRLFEDVNAVPTVLHAESPGAVPLEHPPSRLYPFNRPAGGVGQLPSH